MNRKRYINPLLEEALSHVPAERRREGEISFGVARRINEVLQTKGWSKTDLAQKTGKDNATISRWMSGQHNFTIRTIAMIENVLGSKILDVKPTYNQRKPAVAKYNTSIRSALYLNDKD